MEAQQKPKDMGKAEDTNKLSEADEQKQSLTLEQVPELSDTWLELLGVQFNNARSTPGAEAMELIAPIAADPWSELLKTHGIEMIDLQQTQSDAILIHLNEIEVEQALQIIQEQGHS